MSLIWPRYFKIPDYCQYIKTNHHPFPSTSISSISGCSQMFVSISYIPVFCIILSCSDEDFAIVCAPTLLCSYIQGQNVCRKCFFYCALAPEVTLAVEVTWWLRKSHYPVVVSFRMLWIVKSFDGKSSFQYVNKCYRKLSDFLSVFLLFFWNSKVF